MTTGMLGCLNFSIIFIHFRNDKSFCKWYAVFFCSPETSNKPIDYDVTIHKKFKHICVCDMDTSV